MATYQTAYDEVMPIGIKGQIANSEVRNHPSRTVENPEGVKFGAPAQRGSGDHGVVPYAGGKFMGFAVLTGAVPPVAPGATLVDGYPQHFTGAFMLQGSIYQEAGGAVADGDSVYYNPATDQYVNAAGAGIVGPLTPCVFDTSATAAGQIVEISIRNRSA